MTYDLYAERLKLLTNEVLARGYPAEFDEIYQWFLKVHRAGRLTPEIIERYLRWAKEDRLVVAGNPTIGIHFAAIAREGDDMSKKQRKVYQDLPQIREEDSA